MQLTVEQINETFNDLINSEISREDADSWAYERIKAFDLGELEFSPVSDEEKLWSAIQYLYGIDTKISPTEYMHSLDEVRETFEEKWKI